MNEEIEIFINYLKSKGMNFSQVRRAILNFIIHSDGPFDMDALRQNIKQAGMTLDPSSIYRNLALYVDAGLIEPTSKKVNGKTFFQPKRRTQRAYFLSCPGCLSQVQIEDKALDAVILALCEKYNLNPESVLLKIEARHKKGKHTH